MPVTRYSSTDLSRHPVQLFILTLCVVNSIPTLIGKVPAPASIEALLPFWLVQVWSGLLCSGAVIALVGVAWRNRVTGILIEQVGWIWLFLAAVAYVVAVKIVVGFENGAGISMALILGFGFTAFWRALQIQEDVNELKRLKKSAEAE